LTDGIKKCLCIKLQVNCLKFLFWFLRLLFVYSLLFAFSRKVKQAWDSKRDMLIKSGAFAIEQLSEAMSASADTEKLPDGVPADALRLCSEQVRL